MEEEQWGENLKESCLRAAGRPVAVELKQVLKGVLFGTSQKELQFFLQLKHSPGSPGKKLTLDKIHAMFTRYGIIHVIFLKINSRRPQNSPMRCHTEGTA